MDSDEINLVSFHLDPENLVRSAISGCSSSEENDSEPVVVPKKIRLKVKIPPAPAKRHFCEICNKEFSSGKAYGGHVRIHSKEQSKKKAKKKIPARKRNSTAAVAADGDDVEIIKCCLCGREFNSMHSLFGHMRRHPGRSWKGIRPPPSPETANPLSDPVGSISSSSSCSLLDDDDEVTAYSDEVLEAAWSLLMLSYAARSENDAVSTPNNPREDYGDRKMKGFDLNQPYVDPEMEAEDLRFG